MHSIHICCYWIWTDLLCTHFWTALICLKSFFFLKYWEKGSEIVNDLYDKFYYWKKLVLWRLRLRKTLKWLRKFRFNWQAYLGRLLCGIFEQLWEDRVYGWLLSLLCRSLVNRKTIQAWCMFTAVSNQRWRTATLEPLPGVVFITNVHNHSIY